MRISTEGKVEVERRIAARPETVFSYFTDPQRFVRWQGVDAELDPRPGGLFRVRVSGTSHKVVRGEYVEVDPPRRVVFTWGWEPSGDLPRGLFGVNPGTSTVEIDLVPDGEATILRLRHSGLATDANRKAHTEAWDLTLRRLGTCCLGQDPGPNPFEDL